MSTTARVTKKATCEERGETTYTATFANAAFKTQTRTLANVKALGHDWGSWTVTRPATKTAEGQEVRTCRRCGEQETQVIPKPAKEPDKKPPLANLLARTGDLADGRTWRALGVLGGLLVAAGLVVRRRRAVRATRKPRHLA